MGFKGNLFSTELGKRLKQQRIALGLGYGQLGALLGYRNLSKASRRIRSWEAGTELPTEYRERYLAALQMTEADVDALRLELSDELSVERAILLSEHGVQAGVYPSLVAHAELLREHRERVVSTNWRGVPLYGVNVGLAYVGGTTVPLGALLQFWYEGLFQTDTHWLISGGGSPLSGAQHFYGLQKSYPHHLERLTQVYRPLASNFGPLLQRCRQGHHPTLWAFNAVLTALGADADEVAIFRGTEQVGVWCWRASDGEDTHCGQLSIYDQTVLWPDHGCAPCSLNSPISHVEIGEEALWIHGIGELEWSKARQGRFHWPDGWDLLPSRVEREKDCVLHWRGALPLPVKLYLADFCKSGAVRM